jgi:hypothetical protein
VSSTKSFKDFYNEECEKQALKESKFNSGDSKIRLDKLGNEVSIFLRQLRDYIQ